MPADSSRGQKYRFVVPPLTGPSTGGTVFNRELTRALASAGIPHDVLPSVQRREHAADSAIEHGSAFAQLPCGLRITGVIAGPQARQCDQEVVEIVGDQLPPELRVAASLRQIFVRDDVVVHKSRLARCRVGSLAPGWLWLRLACRNSPVCRGY